MKFIHVTDPHLMPPGQTLCALDPAMRLRAVIQEVNRLHADAAALILTGDISYHGLDPAYELGRELLSELKVPYHLIIGNHDDRAAFKRAFDHVPTDPSGFVQYCVDTPAGTLIMLDTVRHGHEDGEMCPARLEWLAGELERRSGQPVFVFMHHPPFRIGIESIDASRLAQGNELAHLLKRHGDVRHIFYGHVHRAIAGSWHGIPVSTLPGTNHQVGLLLDASPVMIGTHERPAYGVVLIDDETVAVHQKDFLDTSPRFVLTEPDSKVALTVADLVDVPGQLAGRA